MHGCGLVHRDLKPGNVLLAADGPHVIDFGISRAFEGTQLTSAGMVVGTPGYMSPEQAEGQQAGPPSDVFSLGCVLAYAATGNAPFGGGSAASILYRVVTGEPDLSGIPASLQQVITACLAKDPAKRIGLAQLTAMVSALGPPLPGTVGAFWPEPLASIIAADQAPHPRHPGGQRAGRPGLGRAGSGRPRSGRAAVRAAPVWAARVRAAAVRAARSGRPRSGRRDVGGRPSRGPAAGRAGHDPVSAEPRSAGAGACRDRARADGGRRLLRGGGRQPRPRPGLAFGVRAARGRAGRRAVAASPPYPQPGAGPSWPSQSPAGQQQYPAGRQPASWPDSGAWPQPGGNAGSRAGNPDRAVMAAAGGPAGPGGPGPATLQARGRSSSRPPAAPGPAAASRADRAGPATRARRPRSSSTLRADGARPRPSCRGRCLARSG